MNKRYSNPTDRIITKIILDNDCWTWQGILSSKGYPLMNVNQKKFKAHRYSYIHFIGPIPEGLTIDHLCRNRACVSPDHLEAVTAIENIKRGAPHRILKRCNHNKRPSDCRRCGKKNYYIKKPERLLCRTLLFTLTKTTGNI